MVGRLRKVLQGSQPALSSKSSRGCAKSQSETTRGCDCDSSRAETQAPAGRSETRVGLEPAKGILCANVSTSSALHYGNCQGSGGRDAVTGTIRQARFS